MYIYTPCFKKPIFAALPERHKKIDVVDNTDAEKKTGQRCFVCMRVKITNNIYTLHFEISSIFKKFILIFL
jgi:hypothetical protein